MAIKYGKKKHKHNNVVYTIITILLLCAVFLAMVADFYNNARDDAYENLHEQTKQIKDNLVLQLLSDRENLSTMASFAAKLYSDGEDYDLMFESFKPIGLIENIGILTPENVFVTKVGSVDLDGAISFSDEAARGIHISGRVSDLTNEGNELVRSAVPINVDGKTVGILYGVINLDKIGERYSAMAQEFDAQLFVYDKETGNLIVDTTQRTLGNISFLEGRKYNDGYSYEQIISSDKGYSSFRSIYKNENIHLHYSTINEFGWVIAMGRYDSQVFAQTHHLTYVLAIIFTLMLIISSAYVILLMLNERMFNKVTSHASDIRQTLIETLGHKDHIYEAIKQVCRFSKSRAAIFFDTNGAFYHYLSPDCAELMEEKADRVYFRQELLRYASDLYDLKGNVVSIMCIKPDAHLKSTNPEFFDFLKRFDIKEISLSATTDNTNETAILAVVNPKNGNSARKLAERVSACFSIALNNKNHLEKTTLSATTDPLTGVLNRVAFKTDLPLFDEEKASDFSCVFIDVNELHLCNNKYGHAAGDEMLVYIANTLKEVFYGQKLYRMGGDEFLLFCKNVEYDQVKELVSRLGEKLKSRNYHVACGISFRTQNSNTSEMVKEAEEKMYEAKAAYYQNKENSLLPEKDKEYVQAKTGIAEIDTMLSVLKENYNGIYRVSLSTDKAKRILMPAYLNYNENEENFSKLFMKYVAESVDPDYRRAMTSFLNYEALRHLLSDGKTPQITYKKLGGKTVVLSVYKLGEQESVSECLFVFAKK